MATNPNFWMTNPTGQNTYDGTSFALNPYQYASQEGTQFAADNMARLLGGQSPTVYNVQPTAGPYNMPGQAAFGGEGRAADGTMLGGMNAGQVARLYSMYPKHVADQMIADEMKMLSGGAINPQVQIPGQQQTPQPSPAVTQPAASALAGRTGRDAPSAPPGTATVRPTISEAPFTPTGSPGATWTPAGQTPGSPVTGQNNPNPFSQIFANSGGAPSALPSWRPGVNPYTIPGGVGGQPQQPGAINSTRQTSPFPGNSRGAGQFMNFSPQFGTSGGNPVLSMLQNVLGLRASMGRGPLNFGGQSSTPAPSTLAGNYRTTSTPGGYTRWQAS